MNPLLYQLSYAAEKVFLQAIAATIPSATASPHRHLASSIKPAGTEVEESKMLSAAIEEYKAGCRHRFKIAGTRRQPHGLTTAAAVVNFK